MSKTSSVLPRNRLSALDKAKMLVILLPAPALITWALIKSQFTEDGKAKSWKRVAIDRVSLRALYNMNRRQIRAFFGETQDTYAAFIKAEKATPITEEIGENAKLLWIGPKRTDRIILYLHGGAFLWGMMASTPKFLIYLQEELEKKKKPTGVAILNYTLVPDATFPTQLKQVIAAVQHLVNSGVHPQNIQLVGDSAGGIIFHQLLSHILHPVDGVPTLTFSSPLGGAYIMSPWTLLTDEPVAHTNEGRDDILGVRTGLYWGSKVLEGLPESATPYVNPLSAPDDWLDGCNDLVKRVLISAGEGEVLRDAIIQYFKKLEKHHKDAKLFVEEHGIHDDLLMKFLVGDRDLGKLAPFLVNWLDEGFST
ncbi:putative carboxylesterase 2 [Psilocybe cubensis]|uniref:Alpha/beta hydrolase fold-3 domain-containing protein n=2 Tax=Psilocybe cubensis TaxID=181762 RepID=A0A8H7XPE3_PSICU|nr:putative carboxylesterase 2 [Psilocybe cubensis]KAH9477755.1 putative carboxylesterase 2 [Psilocybe cubensis]